MRMRTLVAVLVLAIAMSLSAAPKNDTPKERWRAGQVIAKYKAGFAPAAGKHGVKSAKKVFGKFKLKGKAKQHADAQGLDRVYLLELKKDDVEATVAALKNDPAVEYAEPNWTLSFDAVPDDPSYTSQWGLAKIGAPAAWDTATSGMGVVIGVVDTGIDLTHPDLAANLWTNPGEIPANNVDDDDNGFVDDVHGYDFYADHGNPTDTYGHGTRVAGIIGATGNNATGVSGVAWSAKLAALKIGSIPDVDAAVRAIEYANMMGFRITSNSWGWNEGGQSFLLDDVIEAAEAAGHLFVASAGNDAQNNDEFPFYPSHYANANVVSVTATTSDDALSSYANYGLSSVDLAAPGDGIYSTTAGGGYGSANGTSFATPFVAGAAALFWTANPSLSPAQVRDALMLRSDPLASLHGRTVSGGRLNVANLFDSDAVAPDAIADFAVTDFTHRSVTVRFTATGDDGAAGRATRYDVRVSTSPITAANFADATPLIGEPIPALPGTLESVKLSGLETSTAYYIAARTLDNAGNGSLSNVAQFTTLRAAVLFDDNVEGGARDWTVEGSDGNGGPALWHVEASYVYGTTLWQYAKPVLYGSNYDTGARNWGALVSRELDLTQARDTRLRVSQRVWTERMAGRDLATIQLSVNGGAWTTLMTKQFTGYFGPAAESFDLSAYDGQRIRIRFFIDTVDAEDNDNPGWTIDDVIVDAASANAPPAIALDSLPVVTEDQSATLSVTASDPEGAPLEYKWSFGDGKYAYTTQTSVTHTWTRPGSYNVSVVAYDRSNASDAAAAAIAPVPVNDRPIASISMAAPPLHEETPYNPVFTFTDEENDPGICSYDYGDGSTGSQPCGGSWPHTWAAPGTYTITLIVNDGQDDSLPATAGITILEKTNDKPVARPGGPYDLHPNETATLDGTASFDEETSIASYLWTFADGTTSTSATTSKAFASPGTPSVSLVVTDQTGLSSTAASPLVRVCGGANVRLFTNPIYTCGGPVKLGINVQSGILPLSLTWADGYPQQITQLVGGYYAERVVTPAANTSYSLATMTDFLGCTGTLSTTPVPVVFASATLPNNVRRICPGQSLSIEPALTGMGPWTLTWSDGYVQDIPLNGDRRRTVSPAETTVYSVASATCASCAAGYTANVSGTTTIEVMEQLSAVVTGGGTSCNNGYVPVTITIAGGAPPFSITWSNGMSSSTSSRTYTANFNPSTVTTYTARVTSGSCVVDAAGSATVTPWSGAAPRVTGVSGGTYICTGQQATLTASLSGDGLPFTLTWSDGYVQTAETLTATRTVSPATGTSYSVTSIRNAVGCSGTSTGNAYVSVSAPPTALVRGGGNSCSGGSVRVYVDLSGMPPYTITWADGVTETVNSSFYRDLAPATTTTYAITSVSDARCSGTSSGSATITASTPVSVSVSGGGPWCPGSSTTITATITGGTAPYTLVWSDGVTQQVTGTVGTREVSPASSTTYSVSSISSTCGSTRTGSATVYPAPTPTAAVSGGGSFCEGASTTVTAALTGTAPFTLTWSDGFVQTVPSGSTATRQVSPSVSTVYTVTSIGDARCGGGTGSGSATATPAVPIAVTVSGGGQSCAASPATISATIEGAGAPYTLTWSDGVIQTVSTLTATRTVSPASTTTYTLTSVRSANGCSGTAAGSATVTPIAPISVTVSGGKSSCPAAPVTLTATISGSGSPFTLTWSDGFVQTAETNTATRVVSPETTTTYAISSIANASGCTGTPQGNTTVFVSAPPTATVSGGGASCNGSTARIDVQLTGVGPFTITWADGVTETVAQSFFRDLAPAVTTTYAITSITDSRCSGTSSGSATITRYGSSDVTVSGGGSICPGGSATLTATIAGDGLPYTLTWSDGFVQTANTNTITRSVSPNSSTTYSVTSLRNAGNCSGTSQGSAHVAVSAPPTATVHGGGTSCGVGGTARIYVDLTGVGPFTITWAGGATETVASSFWRDLSPSVATTYSIASVSDSRCSGTSSGSATIMPSSTVNVSVSGGGASCPNSTATITATISGGTAPYTLTWSDGVTQEVSGSVATRQVSVSSPTSFSVVSVSPSVCGSSITGSAAVFPAASPTVAVSGTGTFCEGTTKAITATLTGTAPFTVTWSDGVVQNVASGTTATRNVAPLVATTYTATVSDAYCSGTSSGSAVVTPTKKPVITTQPQSKTIAKRSTTTLTVVTTESGLNYQWYQGASGTTTLPVGTNSSSFTTPKLTATTQYWVKIWKTSCAAYPTHSATATITVQ